MKKVLIIITLLIISCLFVSCKEQTTNKEDIKPTKDFEVSSFITDNSLFQEESKLLLSGKAEPGVVIEATIYDDNNKIISKDNSITDSSSNNWLVVLDTPRGNFEKYSIEITDSYGLFKKTYKNIEFGKLWMIIGDYIQYDVLEENSQKEEADDSNDFSHISYLHIDNNEFKWIKQDSNQENIDEFEYKFSKRLLEKYDMPIGIVNLTFENSNIESFLSLSSINTISRIKEYLISTNKYVENPSSSLDMSYIYNNYLSKIYNLSFEGILYNHGENDLTKFNSEEFLNFYFYSSMTLVEDLHKNFSKSSIYVLGAASNNNDVICKLRSIQNSLSNYFSFTNLIPVFDLNIYQNNTLYNVELNSLVTRISNSISSDKKFSKYANLVYVTDDEEQITKIKVEFSNTDTIKVLNENNLIDNNSINYLDIYYDGELLENVYEIVDNFLIINLEYKEIEIIDGVEKEVVKLYEKEKITISYGEYGNLLDFNFVNEEELPIIPFKIIIK